MNGLWVSLVVGSLTLLTSANALAGGDLRCGTKLVQRGMTKQDVRDLCDAPTAIEKNGTVWVYDFGPDQLLKFVIFVGGKVDFIDERSALETNNDEGS